MTDSGFSLLVHTYLVRLVLRMLVAYLASYVHKQGYRILFIVETMELLPLGSLVVACFSSHAVRTTLSASATATTTSTSSSSTSTSSEARLSLVAFEKNVRLAQPLLCLDHLLRPASSPFSTRFLITPTSLLSALFLLSFLFHPAGCPWNACD